MKLQELIEELEQMKVIYGPDIIVHVFDDTGALYPVEEVLHVVGNELWIT